MYHCTAKKTFLIVLASFFLNSIFGGNISAIIYSISGAVMCLTGMLLLRRIIDENSIIGAVLHNMGQIIIAVIGVCTQLLIQSTKFNYIFD